MHCTRRVRCAPQSSWEDCIETCQVHRGASIPPPEDVDVSHTSRGLDISSLILGIVVAVSQTQCTSISCLQCHTALRLKYNVFYEQSSRLAVPLIYVHVLLCLLFVRAIHCPRNQSMNTHINVQIFSNFMSIWSSSRNRLIRESSYFFKPTLKGFEHFCAYIERHYIDTTW